MKVLSRIMNGTEIDIENDQYSMDFESKICSKLSLSSSLYRPERDVGETVMSYFQKERDKYVKAEFSENKALSFIYHVLKQRNTQRINDHIEWLDWEESVIYNENEEKNELISVDSIFNFEEKENYLSKDNRFFTNEGLRHRRGSLRYENLKNKYEWKSETESNQIEQYDLCRNADLCSSVFTARYHKAKDLAARLVAISWPTNSCEKKVWEVLEDRTISSKLYVDHVSLHFTNKGDDYLLYGEDMEWENVEGLISSEDRSLSGFSIKLLDEDIEISYYKSFLGSMKENETRLVVEGDVIHEIANIQKIYIDTRVQNIEPLDQRICNFLKQD